MQMNPSQIWDTTRACHSWIRRIKLMNYRCASFKMEINHRPTIYWTHDHDKLDKSLDQGFAYMYNDQITCTHRYTRQTKSTRGNGPSNMPTMRNSIIYWGIHNDLIPIWRRIGAHVYQPNINKAHEVYVQNLFLE